MSNGLAIWAVLPVKNTVDAKQRLMPVLAPGERQALFTAMLRDVLTALAGSRLLSGIVVLTRDAKAAAMAKEHGAEVVAEPANDGHSSAIARGAEYLIGQGRQAMLALPGDIPLLTSAEVDALAASLTTSPGFSIAPSSDEFGSNGLLASPPDLVEFAFGDDSFRPHLARARAAGVQPTILDLDGFALDVDQPDDLRRFAASPSDTHAYAYLRDAQLLGRLSRSNASQSGNANEC